MLSRYSHPCSVSDVLEDDGIFDFSVEMLSDSIFDFGVEMLSDMEIVVLSTPGITLGFVVGVAYVLAVVINGVVAAIAVDMLADENANGVAAVITPLEFALSPP